MRRVQGAVRASEVGSGKTSGNQKCERIYLVITKKNFPGGGKDICINLEATNIRACLRNLPVEYSLMSVHRTDQPRMSWRGRLVSNHDRSHT